VILPLEASNYFIDNSLGPLAGEALCITTKNDLGGFIIQTAGKKIRVLGCFLELNSTK
jgi:hypothetical protein